MVFCRFAATACGAQQCANAGSYCGALVGPQSFTTRSQGSVALPVRVQRYAVDAFCSQFARRLKKWSRLAVCKTLAIKRAVSQA